MTGEEVQDAQDSLADRTDGPITAFVLICRATELASRGTPSDVAAEALYAELVSRGYLIDDHDFDEVPGS